jgi:hypothetical protein
MRQFSFRGRGAIDTLRKLRTLIARRRSNADHVLKASLKFHTRHLIPRFIHLSSSSWAREGLLSEVAEVTTSKAVSDLSTLFAQKKCIRYAVELGITDSNLLNCRIDFNRSDAANRNDHGRKSRGDESPRICSGRTLIQVVPQIFVMFQNFKHSPWIRPPPQISTQIYATGNDIGFSQI